MPSYRINYDFTTQKSGQSVKKQYFGIRRWSDSQKPGSAAGQVHDSRDHLLSQALAGSGAETVDEGILRHLDIHTELHFIDISAVGQVSMHRVHVLHAVQRLLQDAEIIIASSVSTVSQDDAAAVLQEVDPAVRKDPRLNAGVKQGAGTEGVGDLVHRLGRTDAGDIQSSPAAAALSGISSKPASAFSSPAVV